MKYDLRSLLLKPVEEVIHINSFDPWEPFQVYGSYSSDFDDMAISVLSNIQNKVYRGENLADEMFREMLCELDFCDYGTSPRSCFSSNEFEELLPTYIAKWKEYYKLQWNREWQPNDQI